MALPPSPLPRHQEDYSLVSTNMSDDQASIGSVAWSGHLLAVSADRRVRVYDGEQAGCAREGPTRASWPTKVGQEISAHLNRGLFFFCE